MLPPNAYLAELLAAADANGWYVRLIQLAMNDIPTRIDLEDHHGVRVILEEGVPGTSLVDMVKRLTTTHPWEGPR